MVEGRNETHEQVREVASGLDERMRLSTGLEVASDLGFGLVKGTAWILSSSELREGFERRPDEELDFGGEGGVDDCGTKEGQLPSRECKFEVGLTKFTFVDFLQTREKDVSSVRVERAGDGLRATTYALEVEVSPRVGHSL